MKKLKIEIILLSMLLISVNACNETEQQPSEDVAVTISVKDVIVVNQDTVSFDSLKVKLAELGVTDDTNVRIVPDPEAGAATIEKVQRAVRNYQYSAD